MKFNKISRDQAKKWYGRGMKVALCPENMDIVCAEKVQKTWTIDPNKDGYDRFEKQVNWFEKTNNGISFYLYTI